MLSEHVTKGHFFRPFNHSDIASDPPPIYQHPSSTVEMRGRHTITKAIAPATKELPLASNLKIPRFHTQRPH